MQPTAQQIADLRTNFFKKLADEGGESVIHPSDLDRAKNNDDWLRRFLLHHDLDMNPALKMMWDTCEWRKQFGTNDISESNIRMDYLIDGSFFSHGKDIDGSTLLIFKCKLHVKGQKDFDELKRCVVYWFERLDRELKGQPITVFFDMDGCGLSNMDMEFTKYLINLLKLYYPYFLNYIIIFEMAWILNAAFKIIKSLLPEKAVAKMKFLSKSNVKDFVPLDQALRCWGGQDDYVFSFIPETRVTEQVAPNPASSKKVHFADGSPMSETEPGFGDRDQDGILSVSPSACINFVKDGAELTSTVTLMNTDDKICLSYKMKTTSPEKFRVRPSAGCLAPGAQGCVNVTLLPGFQLGGLSRDKFLVMSMQVESPDMSSQELTELWKNTSGKNISQHKLRCAQPAPEVTRNGSAIGASAPDNEHNHVAKLSTRIAQLSDCQRQLHDAVKRMQYIQWLTVVFILFMGVTLMYILRKDMRENMLHECYKQV
ncbi:uncharacterized protein CBL_03549 [Carabus blaptoides fortunei]